MSNFLLAIGLVLSAMISLLFTTLSYALRDLSRARLELKLDSLNKSNWLEDITTHTRDLTFCTAAVRMFANVSILLFTLSLVRETEWRHSLQLLTTAILSATIMFICSVALPNSFAKYAGEMVIALCVELLYALRIALWPIIKIFHGIDSFVLRTTGGRTEPAPDEISNEILSVVEEGRKEGVVDEQERTMIESVIQFRDTTVGQIMTARTEMVGVSQSATLAEVSKLIEDSGLSRIPVYAESLDHIIGVLYARDLLKFIVEPSNKFDIRSVMRPAFYVPESKPLRDLLQDFRLQKVHMAIALDEYGGTAGLVTIEDILEELVGEISDEHEPKVPAALKRIDDHHWEADARVYIDELNRITGLSLPDDAGYDTLGGYLTTSVGHIPSTGEVFKLGQAKYTVLDAEPQKVNRIGIELIPEPVPTPESAATQD